MSGGAANEESRGERGEWADVDSHARAMSEPIEDVVRELVELLGAKTLARIAGISETRAIQQWMNGRAPHSQQLLRFTLQVALMVANATDTDVARAWFHGSNPHLNDRSPAALLREGPLEEVQGVIVAAARAFASR
jgi:hypothetical protein